MTDGNVVAVVRLDDLSKAVELTRALAAGGVTSVEFTFTNPNAANVITTVRAAVGDDAFVGAGTVLDAETARIAILAGAQYIVTPSFRPETIQMCRRYSIPAVIGAFTPTEILTAWETGADFVKVHPASLGGPKYFKDVLAPFPHIKLIPSGGVTLENVPDFIKAGAVAVAMGSALVDPNAIQAGDWTS
ncbi:MAG: bifunctional 4-hydroxy-2-oxoglutarate aldolase/2-dehydro-3-deoxy-phosphogluconate aldolase, partial [Thermomicrobiales bacterium]|nr:bifunctional 4-hydroxy-2-oxoglutarate aldolase/2-dehydro-3-deoxy-phosphogluconate aldolase [Thermomicrobiales bacterium]